MYFSEIEEVMDDAMQKVQRMLSECPRVTGDKIGLDPRVSSVWILEDGIAVKNSRFLDYYGGFEYIDSDYIQEVGPYKFYSNDSDRVQEALDYYEENCND